MRIQGYLLIILVLYVCISFCQSTACWDVNENFVCNDGEDCYHPDTTEYACSEYCCTVGKDYDYELVPSQPETTGTSITE